MDKKQFRLERATTLTPLYGNTQVVVTTDGGYLTTVRGDMPPRARPVKMAETDNARIYVSPKGLRMKMVINLPVQEASYECFVSEAAQVYKEYLKGN